MRERREWQEQFQLRTRKQYPAEFWDKSRRGKVRQAGYMLTQNTLTVDRYAYSASTSIRIALQYGALLTRDSQPARGINST